MITQFQIVTTLFKSSTLNHMAILVCVVKAYTNKLVNRSTFFVFPTVSPTFTRLHHFTHFFLYISLTSLPASPSLSRPLLILSSAHFPLSLIYYTSLSHN